METHKFIHRVTVTGADNSVDVSDLTDIAAKYPFVEFGILLSRSRQGGHPRFPSVGWLQEFVAQFEGSGIKCSGHICGRWVTEILGGAVWPTIEFDKISPAIDTVFNRWQLNTHGEHHLWTDALARVLWQRRRLDQKIIFQYDNANTMPIESVFRDGWDNVEALFDLSHGAGVLPQNWPHPLIHIPCGYAGGLSPENVSDQIAKIAKGVAHRTVWIDAETHLRSNERGRDIFDLSKVRSFLENVREWVI